MRLALSLLLIGLAAGTRHFSGIELEWENFKITYSKRYTPVEDIYRMRVFAKNREEIDAHNRLFAEGKQSFRMGINQFADMLNRENRSSLNGLLITGSERSTHVSFLMPHSDVVLPDSVDWRQKGAVTPVKLQNGCGSCWAFSAVGSLEGQHFRKTGELVELSAQELVDCSYDNQRCGGGTMDEAFKDIQQMGGIETEADYPYIGMNDQCHFNKSRVRAHVKGIVDIPIGDEEALKAAVALTGPVAVGIDASWISFFRYAEGVYSDPLCSPTNLDHGMTVVGYGSLDEQDYWIVKNSWGETWGNKGYIYMARNKDNMCGIATMTSYPLV